MGCWNFHCIVLINWFWPWYKFSSTKWYWILFQTFPTWNPVQQQSFHDSKVHGANMGPIQGRQDLGGPHVGPMNPAIWVYTPTWIPNDIMSLASYKVSYHRKLGVVMMPTLLLLAALQVVIITAFGATSGDKVGIRTNLNLQLICIDNNATLRHSQCMAIYWWLGARLWHYHW